ncbi:tigger transposable element-derived protein 4-like [Asterias amurensis]|uniref:tigger transposable element-derived protein 4-like n=1 Tax=Asterias amurensis TaxID=7602 RepID=UPI003AB6581E
MHAWYQKAKSMKAPISGPIIKSKALDYAGKLGLEMFTASNGWLDSFRKHHNILAGVQSSVEDSSTLNDVTIEEWESLLLCICQGYQPADFWTLDETSFYFKALPAECVSLGAEQCEEGQRAEERLTLGMCCSMTGEKEKLLLIGHPGKSNHPFKALRPNELPLKWCSNKRAWMTAQTFEEQLRDLDQSMQSQTRKIILFLGDTTCHPNIPLSNVKLQYFPPSVLSKLQPLGRGIFREVKAHYRNILLEYVLSMKRGMVTYQQIARRITPLDAMYWIEKAWNKTSAGVINQCFAASGFKNLGIMEIKETGSATENNDQVGETLLTHFRSGQSGDCLEWKDFVSFDDDVATYDQAVGDSEPRLVEDCVSPATRKLIPDAVHEECQPDAAQLLFSLNQSRAYALRNGDAHMMGLVMDLRTHLSRVACRSHSLTDPDILSEFLTRRDSEHSKDFQDI